MLSNEEFQELSEVKKQEINMLVDRYIATDVKDINQRLILALDIMEKYRKYTVLLRNRVRILKGIDLRNIDLSGISIKEQLEKANEEERELLDALANRNKDNAIEEFWDCVQVRLGMLQIGLGITADEVMEGYQKHLEKIKNRPRGKRVEKELTFSELFAIFIKQNEILKDRILDYRPAGSYALQIWFKDGKEVIVKYNGAKFEVVWESKEVLAEEMNIYKTTKNAALEFINNLRNKKDIDTTDEREILNKRIDNCLEEIHKERINTHGIDIERDNELKEQYDFLVCHSSIDEPITINEYEELLRILKEHNC